MYHEGAIKKNEVGKKQFYPTTVEFRNLKLLACEVYQILTVLAMSCVQQNHQIMFSNIQSQKIHDII